MPDSFSNAHAATPPKATPRTEAMTNLGLFVSTMVAMVAMSPLTKDSDPSPLFRILITLCALWLIRAFHAPANAPRWFMQTYAHQAPSRFLERRASDQNFLRVCFWLAVILNVYALFVSLVRFYITSVNAALPAFPTRMDTALHAIKLFGPGIPAVLLTFWMLARSVSLNPIRPLGSRNTAGAEPMNQATQDHRLMALHLIWLCSIIYAINL